MCNLQFAIPELQAIIPLAFSPLRLVLTYSPLVQLLPLLTPSALAPQAPIN